MDVYFSGDVLLGLTRLQQPEYQHYREKLGSAKSIDVMERLSQELKALLLVMIA